MILDVGCGLHPEGDVNCDLYVEPSTHRSLDTTLNKKALDAKRIPNFVLCDGQYLPFQDEVFDKAISRQAIEHVENPFLFLSELVRVSVKEVIVETVHNLGEAIKRSFSPKRTRWHKEHHVSKFNFSWFGRAVKHLDCFIVKSYVVAWYYIPHKCVPILRFPLFIGFVIRKEVNFGSEKRKL